MWGVSRLCWTSALLISLTLCAACREEASVQVQSLKFEGVQAVDESALRAVLATKTGSWIPFTKKPAFNADEFERDVQRLRAFYAERGYPDARVTDVDVELDEKKERVKLTVSVAEGEPVRIAAVQLHGFDAVLRPRPLAVLPSLMSLEAGMVRDKRMVDAARDVALNMLKEHGYAYARVDVREAQAAGRDVTLQFQATPGTLATFGPVEIRGNASVGQEVIRRQLTFEPGERFRNSLVQSSQSRLSSLELLQFAYVEPRGQDAKPTSVPMRVTVAEDKHRQFTAAAGYGTEEKVRVRADWRHVNFFGGARTAGIESKWSSLDRGVRLNFAEPYFFTRHLSFSAQGQAWNEREPVYRLNTYGGRATVAWRRDRRDPVTRRGASTSVGLSLVDEYTDYVVSEEALADPSFRDELISLGLDPETGAASGTLVALRLQADHDTTSSRLDPQRGFAVSGALERAGGFLPGAFTYTEVSGEARHYLSTRRQRLGVASSRRGIVFAQRLRAATIDAPAESGAAVPFFKRYFLGGSSSLRGWGRYEVSPLTESGQTIGGLTLIEASSEVRVPVGAQLSLVGFVDVGAVGSRSWRIESGELRADAGPGVRYDTPIGPIRLDLGYQLNPIPNLLVKGEPEKRRWRVHVSIGQAF